MGKDTSSSSSGKTNKSSGKPPLPAFLSSYRRSLLSLRCSDDGLPTSRPFENREMLCSDKVTHTGCRERVLRPNCSLVLFIHKFPVKNGPKSLKQTHVLTRSDRSFVRASAGIRPVRPSLLPDGRSSILCREKKERSAWSCFLWTWFFVCWSSFEGRNLTSQVRSSLRRSGYGSSFGRPCARCEARCRRQIRI